MKNTSGQALVTLLFFMILGLTITVAATIILINSFSSISYFEQGNLAYAVAESGAEEALLKLLRNPSFTSETLSIGNGSATINVAPGNPIVITSTGTYQRATRKIEVDVVYNQNILTISSWKEIL